MIFFGVGRAQSQPGLFCEIRLRILKVMGGSVIGEVVQADELAANLASEASLQVQ
jgi:hypothetical protein